MSCNSVSPLVGRLYDKSVCGRLSDCAASRFHRAEWNSSDPCNTYGNNRDFAQTKLHCLQLNASVGMQRVKAKVFIQDPFNPVLFTEDSERYVDVRNIVCALTSYNYSEDILQFEEGDVILLLDVFQHIYQWSRHFCRGSWDSWDQTTADEAQRDWIPSRRKERFESGFFNYQANKYGKQCRQTFLGIKGIWA